MNEVTASPVGEAGYPEAGDWVLVWGQMRAGNTHPEDVLVEFFSHNEQYACHLRTDRIMVPSANPEFITICTALLRYAGGVNGLLTRCARHHGHGKRHRDSGGNPYSDDDVVGYIEEV